MRGFILKDVLAIQQTIKLYLLIFLVILVASMRFDMGMYIVFFTGLITVFFPLNSIMVDEKSNWNRYAIVLPFARSYIAISKYCLSFLSLLITYLMLYLSTFVLPTLKESISFEFAVGAVTIIILYVIVVIPVALKIGTEKARIVILGVFYIPAIVLFLITEIGFHVDYIALIEENIIWIPIIIGVLTALSIFISIRICTTKDY